MGDFGEKLGAWFTCTIIGGAIGFGIWFFQCVCNFNDDAPPTAFILGLVIGAIVGTILWVGANSEEKAAEEERARQNELYRQQQLAAEAEQQYQNWCNNLWGLYDNIVNSALSVDAQFDPSAAYDQIPRQLNVEASKTDNRYKQTYDYYRQEHISRLKNNLSILMCGSESENITPNLTTVMCASNVLICLNTLDKSEVTKKALDVVNMIITFAVRLPLMYLEQKSYGDFVFELDDPEIFQETKEKMQNGGLNKLYSYLEELANSGDNLIPLIAEGKILNFMKSSAKAMWFYAKQKPYDVDSFNFSIELFNRYTEKNNLPKVEVLLAKIYSKNQLGGKELVRQELKLIDDWIEHIKDFSYDDCTLLASGLAWMELYDIELYLLRKLVELEIQLSPEIQERLSFLENGGTADIKLYQVEETNDFLFDSDSLDWNAKDYGIFFRKLSMKKIAMNYSLAHTKWTKTLPLASGQKISLEELYSEFIKLVEDFDGEVTCEKALARAVNLKNLEYPDSVIFKFTSERNRCISVLFSCEKYGRNLNITILTMFTPDNSLAADSLEQYCQAIKNNMYVESFRESISQVVDSVLNPRQSTYDDTPSNKRTIFE